MDAPAVKADTMDISLMLDQVVTYLAMNSRAEERLVGNLLAVGFALGATLGIWLCLRYVLSAAIEYAAGMTGWQRVESLGHFAAKQVRMLLWWLAVTAVSCILVLGIGYHFAGGHLKREFQGWYQDLTFKEFLVLARGFGSLSAVALTAWVVVGIIRRSRPLLEAQALRWIGRDPGRDALPNWFRLLERYTIAATCLAAFSWGSWILGVSDQLQSGFTLAFRMLTILVVSRLLTLACAALSRPLAELGNRRFARTRFQNYWERLTRLIPFGERCFEAAVSISAASLCVQELAYFSFVSVYGQHIVACIGIFFGARVLIELLQVLLNEAFGLYSEESVLDQNSQTLVRLLHSVCQYVIYVGSLLMMVSILWGDSTHVLAGAGILGIAGGLGAQSLISDMIAGLFILIENQYLVGDFVEIGDAKGTVEAIAIRHTQVRDLEGKLHLIPNGNIKKVVNYSKGYVNAVVNFHVPAGTNLDFVFAAMQDAGRILKQSRKEVLSETVVEGLVDLSLTEMTVQAVTKVRPGTHMTMENEYRRILKRVFDQGPLAGNGVKAA